MTTTTAHPPVVCELHSDTINWDLPAAPLSESDDVLADAVIDGLSYRLVVLQSFDALHQLTAELDREQQKRADLLAEYRALRARVMRDDGTTP
jgi:hypothetical protein